MAAVFLKLFNMSIAAGWVVLAVLVLRLFFRKIPKWIPSRDIELACDERVIKGLGQACKKPYLEALIHCSASGRIISACPLAFGEVDVERRIKNVLHYKKPVVRVLAAAAFICIIAAVCFLTNPFEPSGNQVVMDDYEKAASRIAGAGTSDFEVDCIEYICRESPDIFMPRIKLYMQENSCTFSFSFSALSSFFAPWDL